MFKKKNILKSDFLSQVSRTSSKAGHFRPSKVDDRDWTDTFIQGWAPSDYSSALSPWRKMLFALFIIVAFSGLFVRLFHLQVAYGSKNRELADSNRIQIRLIHAPRGVIYDRNGKILAQNNPGFRLIEQQATGPAKISYVSRDDALKMEIGNDPKLANLEVDSLRSYVYGEKTSHILGYVGEITEEEMKDPNFKNYKLGDHVGRSGVEEIYEKVLRGIDGGEVIEVDAQGKKLRTLRENPPVPGANLVLSIDMDLQESAYKNLKAGIESAKSCCGAAIAQDPKNGEILALVSLPSFDGNDLSTALSNPNSPLLNRAIAGVYPPGSTFKIVSGLAGLSSGKMTASTAIEDTGIMHLGQFTFANWFFTQRGGRDGQVNLIKALQRSNDIYFYQLGQTIGEQVLGDAAKKFGMGSLLGIDLPGEAKGLIPDNAWKEEIIGDVWYPGDTLHMAIGQGFLLTTPLQISTMMTTVAANGKQYPPHLAHQITSPEGKVLKDYAYDPTDLTNGQNAPFNPTQLATIREGLALVPQNGGTAWPFFTFGVPTAGKTGTAEFGDPKDRTHAWYTSYAPVNDPRISLTVLVEAGGEGSSIAGPIVKEIYKSYFSKDPEYADKVKDIAPLATASAKLLGE